jgi:uncharacterized membrane protein YcaP (DUF421 family)
MLNSTYIQFTIELVCGFFALFFVAKISRKSQINEITPFDFISSMVLGELLGNAIYDKDVTIWNILYALLVWTILMWVIEKITQKFRRTRKILDGDPAIIIRNGQIDFDIIKKEQIDINELLSILRQKDIFSVREVEFAILEPSGNVSVLKKSKYDNPTNEDMKLKDKPVYMPINLILDGEVLENNLHTIGFDESWLKKQISIFGVNKIEDVFYAEWKKDEGIHVVPRKGSMNN